MPRWQCALAAVGLLSGLIPAAAAGQEWTQFRGPNGTGISPAKGIPTRWTAQDWKFRVELPGVGHSSPVIWGEKIFLTSANDADATRSVLCLSTKDGRILWRKDFQSLVHHKHKFNSFASPTAAVDADLVYVSWTTPEEYSLLALDHQGEVRWKRNLGKFLSQHSGGTSPIRYRDLLIIGNDQDLMLENDNSQTGESFLLAVEARTGQTRWQVPRESSLVAYSTPCIFKGPQGDELIFNSKSHGITSLNPLTGKLNWEFKDAFDKRSCSSSVVAAGKLLGTCGSGAGGHYLVAVEPGHAAAGREPKLAYKIDKVAPYVPTPLCKDDLLFLWNDKGIVVCAEAASGAELWQKRIGGNYFGSPIWIEGRLYNVSTEGELVVLAADRNFQELFRLDLGDGSHASPAVADGVLYLRTFSHLMAIGRKGVAE